MIGKSENCINSSEYLYNYHGVKASPAPSFDLDNEFEVQDAVKNLISNKLINAAHDCADGGLFVALLEMAMQKQ